MASGGKEKHEAFRLYTTTGEKPLGGSGSWKWTCNFCGKSYTSSITRLLAHVSKLGGEVAPCKEIPQEIADGIVKKYSLIRNQGKCGRTKGVSMGNTSASASVSPSPSPSPCGSTSISAEAGSNFQAKRPRQESIAMKQTAIGANINNMAYVMGKMKAANEEIARTVIDCNLSFNVLKIPQWHKMVKAIAEVGPSHGDWHGITYHEMRTTALDNERRRINNKLTPVRDGWAKYGCSILSDGWSDRKKRGIMNILVSCTLGTYFLRAVDTGKGGQKVTGDFIFRHIRQAIIEVMIDSLSMQV